MSTVICKICSQEIKEDNLKHWWVDHKIKMANYFIKYYDKKSLLTELPIEFKSISQYLLSDFNNKNELKKWLKLQTLEKQREYLREILIKRRDLKELVWIPTQFEQRSSDNSVGISTYNKIFKEGYYNLCESIGYKSRGFNNLTDKTILKSVRNLRNNPIITDTREQKRIKFRKVTEIGTMDVGDYTLKNDNFGIVVDRKELGDLINTMSAGFERFKRELIRAQESNNYIILLCESKISDFLSFNYLPWLSSKIQATPSFIAHRIKGLLQEFPLNFQVGFCDGRPHMKEVIMKIFEMEDYWKKTDIQLSLDLKLFIEGI